jgi:uncharacterized protein YozE (UPF0346 family)
VKTVYDHIFPQMDLSLVSLEEVKKTKIPKSKPIKNNLNNFAYEDTTQPKTTNDKQKIVGSYINCKATYAPPSMWCQGVYRKDFK